MADDQDQRPPEDETPDGAVPDETPSGHEPVSQDDIDRLFEEQGAQQAAASQVAPEVAGMLGGAVALFEPLARQGAEVLGVGIETVAGKRATADGLSAALSGVEELAATFAGIDHIGLDLKLQLNEVESQPVAALVPLSGLAALLSLELDAEQLQDPSFAAGQLQMVGTVARELLDLVSLTLFTDSLSQAELTLADVRLGAAEATAALVAEGTGDGRLVTLAFSLNTGAEATPVTLVLPAALLLRLAELLGDEPDALDSTTHAAPAAGAPEAWHQNGAHEQAFAAGVPFADIEDGALGFGLTSAPDDLDSKVSPIRPGATFGSRKGDDVDVHPVRFPSFGEQASRGPSPQSLDLIMDVQMRVSVELGRSSMSVEDVLALGPGSVVELNKLAGEPVDILVNDRLIARGEVVVVDENFGVRVTEIISPRRRAQAMGR